MTELLIVIAVTGTLIAAVVMGWSQYRQRAYDTAALSCAREIRQLQAQSLTDTGSFKDLLLEDVNSSPACANVVVTSGQNVVYEPYPEAQEAAGGVWGKGAPSAYGYLIRHPAGTKTFAVTESDLGDWADPAVSVPVTAEIDQAVTVAAGGGGPVGPPPPAGPGPTLQDCIDTAGALLTWDGTILRADADGTASDVEFEIYPDGTYRQTQFTTTYLVDLVALNAGGAVVDSAKLGNADHAALRSEAAVRRANWEGMGLTVEADDNRAVIFSIMGNFHFLLPPSFPGCGYAQAN